MRRKWEYVMEVSEAGDDAAEMLRMLGLDGWELTAVTLREANDPESIRGDMRVFYFKREVSA